MSGGCVSYFQYKINQNARRILIEKIPYLLDITEKHRINVKWGYFLVQEKRFFCWYGGYKALQEDLIFGPANFSMNLNSVHAPDFGLSKEYGQFYHRKGQTVKKKFENAFSLYIHFTGND